MKYFGFPRQTSSRGSLVHQLPLLVSFACGTLPPLTSRAAGLVIAPASISNTYSGSITLRITGLTNSETVLVERFLDVNTNGQIDPADWLVGSFGVTDGKVTAFGGVTDSVIPGDNDAVSGQITTSFIFQNMPELSRLAGTHLIRVSSSSGRFAPVIQPLQVTQAAYSQNITGQVTANGAPVPYAGVGLLAMVGNNVEFIVGSVANAAGTFAISAPAGSFAFLPVSAGFVADLGASSVVLNTNQNLTQNLSLTPGQHYIKGKLSDSSSGTGIAAIQLFFQSTNNLVLPAFTDANGNFSVQVAPDLWKIDISDFSVNALGYLRPQSKTKVPLGSTDVTGVSIAVAKGTALVYGSLKNDTNGALAGVSISGGDNLGNYQSSAITDSNGNYDLLVLGGGSWNIGTDSTQPILAGYAVQGTNLTVAAGQAFQFNLLAQRVTAHLTGRVVNSTGAAIVGITILAVAQNGGSTSASAVTAADGSFDLGVSAGTWSVQLESSGAAALNLIGPNLAYTVSDGGSISGITYVVQTVTAHISGVVSNSSGAPVSGLFVYAYFDLNGTNFNTAVQTDSGGKYQLGVFNGTWQVSLDCSGLSGLGYGCPNPESIVVTSGGSGVFPANFTVYPPASAPLLTGAGFLPNGRFQFLVSSTPAQNYTIQDSTTLTNWTTLFITNASGSAFSVIDPNPQETKRFYRVLVGP